MGLENAVLSRQQVKIRRGGSRSCGKDKPYDELRRQTKLVIGLLQSTELRKKDIAELLGIDYLRFSRFVKSLEDDPFTSRLLEDGLPGTYGETLPPKIKVRCMYCNHMISAVPCVSCWPPHRVENSPRPSCQRDSPEAPGVHMKPGSREKIEVMRDRVAEGFSPFSKQDSWFEPDEPEQVWDSDPLFVDGEVDLPSPESLYSEFQSRM
jgi:hypothetical protein